MKNMRALELQGGGIHIFRPLNRGDAKSQNTPCARTTVKMQEAETGSVSHYATRHDRRAIHPASQPASQPVEEVLDSDK